MDKDEGWMDHGIQSDGWRLRSRPIQPGEIEPEPNPLLAGHWGEEQKQPDGSIKQSWVFTHSDHPANRKEQGAAPLPQPKGTEHEAKSSQTAVAGNSNQPVDVVRRAGDSAGDSAGDHRVGGVDEKETPLHGADREPPVPVRDSGGSSVADPGATDNGLGEHQDDGDGMAVEVEADAPETESLDMPNLNTQRQSARVSQSYATAAFAGSLSAQFPAVAYKHSEWKKSRVKKGKLIRRLSGYSIAETEYGVSYLWVLSRKPDRTSADNSVWPMAGYFNWKSLEQSGLLRKEKKQNGRNQG